MKICVSLRDPVGQNLREGNLRSEPRWERLVIEASISNPEVTEIYTVGFEWAGGRSVTNKYKGLINQVTATDSILLLQDWNLSVVNSHRFKAIVVNIFCGPWLEQVEEIKTATALFTGNIFFVLGHPALYAAQYSHLLNFTNKSNVFLLPLPWIPESCYKDSFHNKNLLWAHRTLFLRDIADSLSFQWALGELLQDSSLHLRVLTGWKPEEVKDWVSAEEVLWVKEDINDYFWKMEALQPYLSIRDRVTVFYGLDWSEILVENTHAKLLVVYDRQYGGPPMEAAMHGVPFVGDNSTIGALVDCPGYLHTSTEEEACVIFKRLMEDHNYYTEIALKYHDYAVKTYSFDSFNYNLNQILKSKGIF